MRIAKGSANSIIGTITKKESGTNLAISAQTRTNKLCSRRVRDLRTSMRCTSCEAIRVSACDISKRPEYQVSEPSTGGRGRNDSNAAQQRLPKMTRGATLAYSK
jgi:hypothetical protein